MRIICRTYVIAQIGLLTLLGLVGIGCQAPPPFAPADSLASLPYPNRSRRQRGHASALSSAVVRKSAVFAAADRLGSGVNCS